ncbi:hypothetical protein O6H91_17G031500 [Diphasiastrum complanatum]|uniref:Uncharacterized protein n=2 Tax=Diphasiastrum complanatum TaxID=34168 RepID=A0ACC2B5E3_DIPCM|nr:hypothetical protein O6H91_17G031500 [Diphasiastrum complanatum]
MAAVVTRVSSIIAINGRTSSLGNATSGIWTWRKAARRCDGGFFRCGRLQIHYWSKLKENGQSRSWEISGIDGKGNAWGGVEVHKLGPALGRFGSRRLWISVPLQMGRRSSKIATRKGAQDAKKAKLYGKIGKQIISAVQGGGPNPMANAALAALLQQAREFNVPKDIIDRNIKKASEKGQQNFVESTYEVYAFGGVGLVLEVLTDNANRTAALIRDAVKKGGGKMADPNSVLFNFKRAGIIYVRSDNVDGDKILLAAMDAGAEDVLEPPVYDEDEQDSEEYKYYKIICSIQEYSDISLKLQEAGIPVDLDSSGLELIPLAAIEPDDEAVELNKELIEKLLEVEDVDAVYSNQK